MEYKKARYVDRLEIKLTEEQEAELNKWIDDKKNAIEEKRNEFVARHQKYIFNFDDFITYGRKGAWEGASNKHMPLTAIMVKSYQSRLYNIFVAEDTVQLSPREETDISAVEMAKRLRTWYLWDYINGFKGIRGFTRELCYDTVTVGFGLGMKDWITKQRKILAIEPQELKKEMADLEPQLEEAKARSTEIMTEEEIDNASVDITPYREVPKIITIFEGSRVKTIPFENAYFPNDIPESNDLDYPACVIIDTTTTVGELRLRAKQQEWDEDKVDQVINENNSNRLDTRAQNVQEQRGSMTGYDKSTNTTDKEERIIEYCFCTYDIDDDGLDEEIVVTRSEKGTVLKVTWLDRISRSGMRPLYKFDCFSKPRQAYSRGVPEFMYPLNEEMDELHNMRINALALQTCPFGTYRASSSLKNQPIRIAPGKFIPVDETTDLKPFTWSLSATALGGEEDRLWHYAERQTSVSSLTQGIVPDRVGPTRSTSGVLTLLQQMDKEFKVTIDQCADQWKKLEKMLMDDLDWRIDGAVKMRVLGASVEDFVDPADKEAIDVVNQALRVNSSFDIKIDVASIIQSDEVKRNEASIILDKVSAPSAAHQFGVLTPKALYKAWQEYLSAWGKDPDQFLDEPTFVTKPLTLYQEIQICGQGEIPPMSMQDDHWDKAQMLRNFMQESSYIEAKQKGLYVSNVDDYMIKAIQKHLVLNETLKPKGMPNPSGQNDQDINKVLAGQAPQQGGENGRGNTNRAGTQETAGNERVAELNESGGEAPA